MSFFANLFSRRVRSSVLSVPATLSTLTLSEPVTLPTLMPSEPATPPTLIPSELGLEGYRSESEPEEGEGEDSQSEFELEEGEGEEEEEENRRRAVSPPPEWVATAMQSVAPDPTKGLSYVHSSEAAGSLAVMNNNGNVNYNAPNGIITNNNHVEMLVVARNQLEEDLYTIERGLARHHVPHAVHDAQPVDAGCMEGTRVQLLGKARDLVTCPGGAHLVWIVGMAGTGKTSIALTLCRSLCNDPTVCLAGTFFCSRSAGAVERTNAQRIVSTLSMQLSRAVPACATALAAELKKDPDLAHKSIHLQVERLLVMPLKTLGALDRPIVFVIDALDECSNHHQLTELLNAIAGLEFPVLVKFLVTSRPDLRIRQSKSIRDLTMGTHLSLETNDPVQLMEDILLYIKITFESNTLPDASPWYTERDVEELAQVADGLFIFAAVAVAHILAPSDYSRRSKRLRRVKNYEATSALTPLEVMYALILNDATASGVLEPEELLDTRRVIAAIVSCRAPLSVKTLAELLSLSLNELRGALDGLHAVIFVPRLDEEGELRALHATFIDFLFTRAPETIRLNMAFCHDFLADACMRRLDGDDLCFNISHCQSSYEPTTSVEPIWVANSLRYACLHWGHHFVLASHRLDNQFEVVLKRKFLFWLEALSLIGGIGLASELLLVANSRVQSPGLSRFLRDAIELVGSFHEAIVFNASHIYISAIPFSPEHSLVRQTFLPLLEGLISVEISGISTQNNRSVVAATVSSDGRATAVASADGSVEVWDAKTCANTRSVMLDLERAVCVVAISAGGRLIATGLVNHNVLLFRWEASNERHDSLNGHEGRVTALSFSQDDTQLVSGSEDQTVRLWEVKTGRLIVTVATPSSVSTVALSPDGCFIAAGYSSRSVQIFHAANSEQVRTFKDPRQSSDIGSDGIVSLAFATDGNFTWIASGNDILGLSLNRNAKPPIAAGHASRVNAVALSRCGQLIASGADDATIRLWDAKTGNSYGPPLRGHAEAVISVALSPSNRSIVSTDSNGIIRVWRLKKFMSLYGQHEQSPLESLSKSYYEGGWLVNPDAPEQRLLWVPPEHRGHLEIGDYSRVVAARRVILTTEPGKLHLGEHWFKCWRSTN